MTEYEKFLARVFYSRSEIPQQEFTELAEAEGFDVPQFIGQFSGLGRANGNRTTPLIEASLDLGLLAWKSHKDRILCLASPAKFIRYNAGRPRRLELAEGRPENSTMAALRVVPEHRSRFSRKRRQDQTLIGAQDSR